MREREGDKVTVTVNQTEIQLMAGWFSEKATANAQIKSKVKETVNRAGTQRTKG